MPILPLALPPGSNAGIEPHAGIAATINCYAVQAGEEQKTQMQIWAVPGLVRAGTLTGIGGVRGMIEVDGQALVVAGRTLSAVDAGGGSVVLGGIPSDGHVGMGRNQRGTGAQTIIVCDGLVYISASGSLQQVGTLPAGPVDVCVVNRSAIYAIPDGRLYRSEIDDGSVVSGLDTVTAESAPDGLHRVVDRGGDFLAIGPRSVEVWSDIGGDLFGFARAAAIRIGSVGPRSVTKATVITGQTVTDTVAWLTTDQSGRFAGVAMLDGVAPRKISTAWIDRKVEDVAAKADIVATSWVSRGYGFVCWRLPDTTLVYNTTTGVWHERQSRNAKGEATTWRVGLTTVLGGRVLCGDATSPTLYWLDEDTADEDGREMVVTVRTPPANAFPGQIEVNRLWLDAVPGVGLASGAAHNVDPMVSMRYSRDGETWSTARLRRLGRQGQRETRVEWARLGTVPAGTFEFSCSAKVARGILRANWEGEPIKP